MSRKNGQGSVSLRKNGKYMGRIMINGKLKTFYGDSQNEVEILMQKYSMEKFDEQGNVITFADYVKDYIFTYKYMHIKNSSFDRIESIYRNHVENSSIGSLTLLSLNDVILQKYINECSGKGLSYSSVKKIFELVRSVLYYAYRKHDIDTDYGSLLHMPSKNCFAPVKSVETYTLKECALLKDYILNMYSVSSSSSRTLRYGPVYLIMLHTGLRSGEMLALKWSDIDFENKFIHVENTVVQIKNRSGSVATKNISVITKVKTDKSVRDVPLSDLCIEYFMELKNHYLDHECLCDYVCCNLEGEFIRLRSFEAKLEKICKLACVKYKGCHALRHTFATMLIDSGTPPKVVSDLLGHTNVAFTLNRYVHVNDADKIKALENINY